MISEHDLGVIFKFHGSSWEAARRVERRKTYGDSVFHFSLSHGASSHDCIAFGWQSFLGSRLQEQESLRNWLLRLSVAALEFCISPVVFLPYIRRGSLLLSLLGSVCSLYRFRTMKVLKRCKESKNSVELTSSLVLNKVAMGEWPCKRKNVTAHDITNQLRNIKRSHNLHSQNACLRSQFDCLHSPPCLPIVPSFCPPPPTHSQGE